MRHYSLIILGCSVDDGIGHHPLDVIRMSPWRNLDRVDVDIDVASGFRTAMLVVPQVRLIPAQARSIVFSESVP